MTLGTLGQSAQQSCIPLSCNPGPGVTCPQSAYDPVQGCPVGYKLGNPLAAITGTSTGFPTSMVTTLPSGQNVVTSYNPSTGIISTPTLPQTSTNLFSQCFSSTQTGVGGMACIPILAIGGLLLLLLLMMRSS